MKKFSLSLLIIVSILLSCSNPELDAAKKKAEESKCKADFAAFLLDNGNNTMVLGARLGLSKELEQFQKLQSDSTISCDSLKKAWSLYSELVDSKAK